MRSDVYFKIISESGREKLLTSKNFTFLNCKRTQMKRGKRQKYVFLKNAHTTTKGKKGEDKISKCGSKVFS